MNNNTFTFAELEVLGRAEPHWDDVRQLLSIENTGPGIEAAGVSSLIMRGLAHLQGGAFEVRGDVSAYMALLLRPSRVVSLTRADESGLTLALALLPVSGAPTCVVSMGGPGVYEITALKPADDAAIQLAELIVALAKDGSTAMTIGPTSSPGELLLGHDGTAWRLGRTADEPAQHGTTSDESAVAAAVLSWLRAWLAA